MLDPNRIGLNAADVGFRIRTKQGVNWTSFSLALQTQTDAIKVRRELEETPISVVHVMGGQGRGRESNEELGTRKRQIRQMNGYQIRSFTAENGPIIPGKMQSDSVMAIPMNLGIPQYVKYNAVAGQMYVSQFVEPLNAPLEHEATLQSQEGIRILNARGKNPEEARKWSLNMNKSQEQIDANEQDFNDIKNKASQERASGKLTDRTLKGAASQIASIRRRSTFFNPVYDGAQNLKPFSNEQLVAARRQVQRDESNVEDDYGAEELQDVSSVFFTPVKRTPHPFFASLGSGKAALKSSSTKASTSKKASTPKESLSLSIINEAMGKKLKQTQTNVYERKQTPFEKELAEKKLRKSTRSTAGIPYNYPSP